MFSSTQIIPATLVVRNFKEISKRLAHDLQALLITQKGKDSLVLVNACIFEKLLSDNLSQKEVDSNFY